MASSKPSNRSRQVSKTQSVPQQLQQQPDGIISQQWSGPLPPPAALAQFNSIIPNGAERIIAMVEQEQAHRIDYEKTVLQATIYDTKRGHWMGWTISIVSLALASLSAYLGAHPTVSIALVSIPVLGMVQSILKSKSINK